MSKFKDVTGQVFGYWTVVKRGTSTGKHTRWVCRCRCGREHSVTADRLAAGRSKSCGHCTGHGHTSGGQVSPEYQAYASAKARCTLATRADYYLYGGRGIEFKFKSFPDFLAEVGPRPSAAYSIDRIDTNGHYEKGNLRWATRQEQAKNRRYCKKYTSSTVSP